MMKFDSKKVIHLQKLVVEYSGGAVGVRDLDLLDSALNSCFQTFDDVDLYPTIEEKAARLGFSLVSNHPFIDGNKRIGVLVMLSFLEANGIKINYTDDDLIKVGMSLANGKMSYENLLKWLCSHKKSETEISR